MINQREKQVTYGSAFSDYFRGFVDFTGYSTRAGHWFPFGTIYGAVILIFIIFFGSVISSIIGIGNRASSSYYYTTRSAGYDLLSTASNALIFLVIFYIILFILAIPTTASFARRLRDVGFAAWGIVLAVVIFYLLNIFSIYIVTPLYDICFIFVLMSLPSNCLETDKNDDFSKFLFRQTRRAQQYYGQFNNNGQTFYQGQNGGQFNQYGQQNYQNGQQQFNQNQQGYNGYQNQQNPNFQGNNGYQSYNNQNQGYPQFDQYGNPINPNLKKMRNQGVNPNQGQNPNGPRPQQPIHQGQPNQGVNPNQGQNPNGPRPQQPTNQGPVNPGVNLNHQEQSPVKEAPKPQETVQKQEVPTPEVKETPEVNESVEVKKEVNETPSVQGGVKSRRLQKLNKPEEEQTILKRRNK
jgi:sporozoite surface protein 2